MVRKWTEFEDEPTELLPFNRFRKALGSFSEPIKLATNPPIG
jgi:hypothetical protein